MRSLCVLLLSAFCCLLAVTPAVAGPAAPLVVTLTQPNGIAIEAIPYGDEWANGYETADGHTIALDEESGYWRYAVLDNDGALAPGPLAAGIDKPDSVSLHLRALAVSNPNRFAISAVDPAGNIGTQRVLVLLASFSNRGPVGSTPGQWASLFFAANNSVMDYYRQASYGLLTLSPATESHGAANDGVVGWLNLGYSHPNPGAITGDANRAIVRNAIIAANDYVDFSSYDTNADGIVTNRELHIVTIVAGYEMSYGGYNSCSPRVWAHSWSLYGAVPAPIVDGVEVGGYGYTQVGEWHCMARDNPGHMATMGQNIHEIGHDLGWPDLYDTDQSSEGVGNWDIMASGGWLRTSGYAGSMPAHPGAFLKWYQGWLLPFQATGVRNNISLAQVESTPRAIQLLNDPGGIDWVFGGHAGAGEYFLVENRQRSGYDSGLPGCGLLVWHIDESVTSSNAANAADSHRLVDLEEADGRNDLDHKTNRGDAGDPYLGSSGNDMFNAWSNPDSRLYSHAESSVVVTGISGCSATMTADFAAPGAVPATATPTRTATRTATSVAPTRTATRTPTATHPPAPFTAVSRIFLPVIVKNQLPATAAAATSGYKTRERDFPGSW